MDKRAMHKCARALGLLGTMAMVAACDGGSSGSGSSGSGVQGAEETAFCEASDAAVVNDFDPATLPPLGIPAEKKTTLQTIRNAIFGGSLINAALQQTTISGEEPPIFALELEDRALLVWRINDSELDAFSQDIALPSNLTLARTTLPGAEVDDNGMERHYYLLADIGNATRTESGAMIEWKTFVNRGADPTPRLYRFNKAVAEPGLDLLQVRNDKVSTLQVELSGERLSVLLNDPAETLEADIPLGSGTAEVFLTREFLTSGEVTLGRGGLQSSYYYDGSSVSAPFRSVTVGDVIVNGNSAWLGYTDSLEQVLVASRPTEFLVQPRNASIPSIPEAQCLADAANASNGSELFACLVDQVLEGQPPATVYADLQASGESLDLSLPALATLHYAVTDLYQGLTVFVGVEKPKLFFALKPEPKAIFINFEIPEDRAADFKREYLPESFELAKIRFYPEQCEPVYAVSLNVYESVGQNLDSFRAEWSTYVINPAEEDPKPRFSVLEAQSTAGGFDPVVALERYRDWQTRNPGQVFNFLDPDSLFQLIEEPNPDFTYAIDNNIRIMLNDAEEGITVDVDIAYPEQSRLLTTMPLTGWMEANDFVYWEEVADILKYDSNVMFAELLVFEALPTDVIVDNAFEGYVNPEPLPIILWNGPQNIALEPWGNLDDIPTAPGD